MKVTRPKKCSRSDCLFDDGPAVDWIKGVRTGKLPNKEYFQPHEQKMLEKLMKIRAAYDETRNEILMDSGLAPNLKLANKKYNAQSGDNGNKEAIRAIIELIDRGEVLQNHTYLKPTFKPSDYCSCCPCNTKVHHRQKNNLTRRYRKKNKIETSSSGRIHIERRISNKHKRLRSVHFRTKQIQSDPCTCTLNLKDHINEPVEQNGDDFELYTPKSSTPTLKTLKAKSVTCKCHLEAFSRKSLEKIIRASNKLRNSIKNRISKLEASFHIKKDSLALFRERLKLRNIRKIYECEPGFCIPEECVPIKCYEKFKLRRKHRNSASGASIKSSPKFRSDVKQFSKNKKNKMKQKSVFCDCKSISKPVSSKLKQYENSDNIGDKNQNGFFVQIEPRKLDRNKRHIKAGSIYYSKDCQCFPRECLSNISNPENCDYNECGKILLSQTKSSKFKELNISNGSKKVKHKQKKYNPRDNHVKSSKQDISLDSNDFQRPYKNSKKLGYSDLKKCFCSLKLAHEQNPSEIHKVDSYYDSITLHTQRSLFGNQKMLHNFQKKNHKKSKGSRLTKTTPMQNIFKIGSNINFNIEFFKENVMNDFPKVTEKSLKNQRTSAATKENVNISEKRRHSINVSLKKRPKKQSVLETLKTPLIIKCLCGSKIIKSSRKVKPKKKQISKVSNIKTKSRSCQCKNTADVFKNPRNLVKHSNELSNIPSENFKSISSGTSKFYMKKKITKAKMNEPSYKFYSEEKDKFEGGDAVNNKRFVRFGSNISINIEFYKQNDSIVEDSKQQTKKNNAEDNDLFINTEKLKISENDEVETFKNEQGNGYCNSKCIEKQLELTENIQKKQKIENKNKKNTKVPKTKNKAVMKKLDKTLASKKIQCECESFKIYEFYKESGTETEQVPIKFVKNDIPPTPMIKPKQKMQKTQSIKMKSQNNVIKNDFPVTPTKSLVRISSNFSFDIEFKRIQWPKFPLFGHKYETVNFVLHKTSMKNKNTENKCKCIINNQEQMRSFLQAIERNQLIDSIRNIRYLKGKSFIEVVRGPVKPIKRKLYTNRTRVPAMMFKEKKNNWKHSKDTFCKKSIANFKLNKEVRAMHCNAGNEYIRIENFETGEIDKFYIIIEEKKKVTGCVGYLLSDNDNSITSFSKEQFLYKNVIVNPVLVESYPYWRMKHKRNKKKWLAAGNIETMTKSPDVVLSKKKVRRCRVENFWSEIYTTNKQNKNKCICLPSGKVQKKVGKISKTFKIPKRKRSWRTIKKIKHFRTTSKLNSCFGSHTSMLQSKKRNKNLNYNKKQAHKKVESIRKRKKNVGVSTSQFFTCCEAADKKNFKSLDKRITEMIKELLNSRKTYGKVQKSNDIEIIMPYCKKKFNKQTSKLGLTIECQSARSYKSVASNTNLKPKMFVKSKRILCNICNCKYLLNQECKNDICKKRAITNLHLPQRIKFINRSIKRNTFLPI